MDKRDLLFYEAYEDFYQMADSSGAFAGYCADAFGEDLSQDGFGNMEQVMMILPYIPVKEDAHILDIGCGNGKMLGFLQKKTGAYIHGFDYSENAVRTAEKLFPEKSDFREGIIGEISYPAESFDVIISMDTMYFAEDMTAFVGQIKQWLRKDGVFFVGYQEGDVIPVTENAHTTLLAKALKTNDISYEAHDITDSVYGLLINKRRAAGKHKEEFIAEGHRDWYDLIISQTDYASCTLAEFREKMARYSYIIRK